MKITVYFETALGDRQVEQVTYRINTTDFVSAVAESINQATQLTTIKIVRISIEAEK